MTGEKKYKTFKKGSTSSLEIVSKYTRRKFDYTPRKIWWDWIAGSDNRVLILEDKKFIKK